ncbi:hypothetical protein Dthio_PD3092 [Desulfonatronospira thiodismutans ASO3-1]|uniref:Uncharacterized protein n=1 Tax=Desulfonatronospira thiodismutans ASO3-1 TaxID=555779 RepID=D6SLV2_9BACT|nr:hypothetical protein [Desulfonatronospira thiodismutans]EFI35663.1 hypothetical protein Dthio_PD3092 [Desulfonatronospira thiodismutans ASO3-1]
MAGPPKIIHFPYMHEELVSPGLRPMGLFLNPGIKDPLDIFFTPQGLVLDKGLSEYFLEQCRQFGEQFKKTSDMTHLGMAQMEDFYTGSTQSIQYELSTYGKSDEAKEDHKEDLLQAQQYLLLNFALEERLLELGRIDADLSLSWSSFDESLGIDDEEEHFQNIARQSISPQISTDHWQKLLKAYTAFLPPQGILLVHEESVSQELQEYGIAWERHDPDHFFPGLADRKGLDFFCATLNLDKIDKKKQTFAREVKLLRAVSSTNSLQQTKE